MKMNSNFVFVLQWRHVGNDHVHIVWNEHCRPYVRSVMPTQFADVLIVLSPLPNKLVLVNISCKHPVSYLAEVIHFCWLFEIFVFLFRLSLMNCFDLDLNLI